MAVYITQLHKQRAVWLEAQLDRAQAQTQTALTITKEESERTNKLLHYVEIIMTNQADMKAALTNIERKLSDEGRGGGRGDDKGTRTSTRTASGGRQG